MQNNYKRPSCTAGCQNSRKETWLEEEKMSLHLDNIPVHKGALATGELRELVYELLSLPHYFPALAPSDRIKWSVLDETFHSLPDSYFREGILLLGE
ncbi:hypothetical protein TNCV_4730161 [Trichonephila clavipes]|nr:hypothetical protein TNCV_4730161 [Trichonephila clavipes]